MAENSIKGRYKIKTVAERTGFSPTLLRAWERRYAFLEPVRQPSGHRLYSDNDLHVLKAVKLLLDRGQSVGEVAALGRDSLLRLNRPGESLPLAARPSHLRLNLDSTLLSLKQRLIESVKELNEPRARRLMEELFDSLGSMGQVRVVSREIGEDVGVQWAEGKLSVASEHLISNLWEKQLHRLIRGLPESESGGKLFLCAGLPDEQHEIGLLFLQHFLQSCGHRCVCLGAALPLEDLEAAVRRLQPHVVCLSVARGALLEVHLPQLAEAVRRHPTVQFLIGGKGVGALQPGVAEIGAFSWVPERPLEELSEVLFS